MTMISCYLTRKRYSEKRRHLSFWAAACLVAAIAPSMEAQISFLPESVNRVYAVCITQQNIVVPNCNISQILVNAEPGGDWHWHDGLPRYGNPRQGSVTPTSGNSGQNGLPVQYQTTRIGQPEKISACAAGGGCTDAFFAVEYRDLVELWGGYAHVMTGASTIHPYNHFFHPYKRDAALAVIQQYHDEFVNTTTPEPWQPIGVNDSSLPKGGVFDICATDSTCVSSAQNPSGGSNPWGGPHSSYQHDRGTAVDFRANSRPNHIINSAAVKQRFVQICRANGFSIAIHESPGSANEHIHCAD